MRSFSWQGTVEATKPDLTDVNLGATFVAVV